MELSIEYMHIFACERYYEQLTIPYNKKWFPRRLTHTEKDAKKISVVQLMACSDNSSLLTEAEQGVETLEIFLVSNIQIIRHDPTWS